MILEDYFDFLSLDDIRLKGTRVGIEHVLYEYIYREQTAEEIAKAFPSTTLEQIYATILYYLHNRQEVEAYIVDWLEYSRRAREEQERNPPPFVLKMRAIKAELQKKQANTLPTSVIS